MPEYHEETRSQVLASLCVKTGFEAFQSFLGLRCTFIWCGLGLGLVGLRIFDQDQSNSASIALHFFLFYCYFPFSLAALVNTGYFHFFAGLQVELDTKSEFELN